MVRILAAVLRVALCFGIAADVVRAQPAITEYPLPTSPAGPSAIAPGEDGNLWLAETMAGKIAKVSPAGAITEFPIPTSGAQPMGIAAGPDGNLWFTEFGSGKIGRITPAGAFTEFSLPQASAGPLAITRGPDGALWFTESVADRIGRITTSGVVTEYPLPAGANPLGIAAGPDGNVWFTEAGANQVGRITPAGVIQHYDLTPVFSAQSGLAPGNIASGPLGRLWFTTAGAIWSITTAGETAQYAMPDRNARPAGIAAGPDGSIWYTELTGSKIGKLSPEGVFAEWATPTANAGPAGIVAGPDGNLWFAENTANRVVVAVPPKTPAVAPLTLSASSLTFTTWAGGPVPAAQTLTVTAPHPTAFTPSVSVLVSYGKPWLSVSPTGPLTTDATLTVSVDPKNIGTYGAYSGAILLTAGDVTQVVPVTMNITQPPKSGNVTLSPTSLHYTYTLQSSVPLPQLIQIQDATPGVSFTPVTISSTIVSPPNGRWLSLTTAGGQPIPNGGSGNGQMSIQAVIDPVGLAPGVYQATITIAPTGGAVVVAPVELTVVAAQAPVTAAPSSLVFTWEPGAPVPAPQTVRLAVANPLDAFSAGIFQTASWLAVTPPTGTGSATLTVSVQPAGLLPGAYRNRIDISLGRIGASASVDVVLNVAVSGARIQEFPVRSGATPLLMTKGPDGAIWVSQQMPHSLGRLATDGSLTDFPTSLLPGAQPFGITAGPDGALWFTERNGAIGRLSTTGDVRHFPLRNAAWPWGLAAGPDGNLWFTDQPYSVGKITTSGTVTEYRTPSDGQVGYIAAGPDGNLWFTQAFDIVGKITPEGRITEYRVPGGRPIGITAGPDGNLWFTEPDAGKIGKITTDGVITEYTKAGWFDPQMITVGPDGNLWFTEQNAGKIGKITPTGTITEYEVPTFSAQPFGISAGPDGNIWFTEINARQIGRVLLASREPSIQSIANAASFVGPWVAPGEIVSIGGSDLGPESPLGLALGSDGKVATSLGGVTVTFNGQPAPLLYVSATQINCVVPYEVEGRGNIEAKLTYAGRTATRRVDVVSVAPAIFTATGSGKGAAAIANANGVPNSATNPAAVGEVVTLYLTGEGQTEPAGITGSVTVARSGGSGPVTPRPKFPVSVYIDGKKASVEFAGEAPNMVAGVLQVNARIPEGVRPGSAVLVVTLDMPNGQAFSQDPVTVAVK